MINKKKKGNSLIQESGDDREGLISFETGVVVSDKMTKTLVVEVMSLKSHPKYKKRIKESGRYKIHDIDGKGKKGDVVSFVQCRPISGDKHWKLLKLIKSAN